MMCASTCVFNDIAAMSTSAIAVPIVSRAQGQHYATMTKIPAGFPLRYHWLIRRLERGPMARLLIVEDDVSLRENLMRMLQLKGHECLCCESFTNAAAEALAAAPDCILLDLSLPGAYGHEICRAIRQESNVPIIVLTSSDSEFDEVMSMNVGADDYVVKPYRPAALLARIDRALARSGSADSARGQIDHGGVSLDSVRAVVSYRGKSVELSRNELLILRVLMENAGSIISRSELMDELWQTDAFVDDNTLTVNVNRLRRSLESAGVPDDFITTRRGLGYVVR